MTKLKTKQQVKRFQLYRKIKQLPVVQCAGKNKNGNGNKPQLFLHLLIMPTVY